MLHDELDRLPLKFIVQFHHKQTAPKPLLSRYISRIRYRIECIFGRLVERYHLKQRWARDLWHLANRVMRKVLSHTTIILLQQKEGHQPATRLAELVP